MAAQVEAPQRGSRSVYEAKWTIFTKWCLSNQVNFREPPIKSIADFLLYSSRTGSYSQVLLRATDQQLYTNWEICPLMSEKDESLTHLLDCFHRDGTNCQKGIPSRNFSLVLHQLTKAPFEPLKVASLKHLTFKTVFLLALGSGKCRSEIHAWLSKSIRHKSDWSKVYLYPSPSFLSKNQLVKEGPDIVGPCGYSSPFPNSG